jgi:hypothetical protein
MIFRRRDFSRYYDTSVSHATDRQLHDQQKPKSIPAGLTVKELVPRGLVAFGAGLVDTD